MKLYSILLLGFFVSSVQAMEEKEQTTDIENNTTMQAMAIACTAAAVANANTPTADAPRSQRLYWDEEVMMPIEPQYKTPGVVYKRYNPNGN